MIVLPTQDSQQRANYCRAILDIDREKARWAGQSAVEIIHRGGYVHNGIWIDLSAAITKEKQNKQSLPPAAALPLPTKYEYQTTVQIVNESSLMAARRFSNRGVVPLVLNFANGVSPGGGFLHGSRAQEETLCFASTLYASLVGDPFYKRHRKRSDKASSTHTILSEATVFRDDLYENLSHPWKMGVMTCAAPVCRVGEIEGVQAQKLMEERIRRVLAIAHTYDYQHLVLGAWGCGAFQNDPVHTAQCFRRVIETEQRGAFAEVVFAISDWSAERRFLGPFHQAFQAG